MEQDSKIGGSNGSVSASINSPSPKPATSSTPRMLTPSELASLRQQAEASDTYMRGFVAAAIAQQKTPA